MSPRHAWLFQQIQEMARAGHIDFDELNRRERRDFIDRDAQDARRDREDWWNIEDRWGC